MSGAVTLSIERRLGIITFSHPAHNSLPSSLLRQLADQIKQAGNSDDIDLIILQSDGDRTFCAGASFDELMTIDNEADGKTFFLGFAHVINAIRKCSKIIIGRVQGKAIGGGVGIAAACDYCIATKYASVKLSEIALGIGPFVVGPAIERKIGMSAFSNLAINATEWQTAAWAKEKGLFHEAFESIQQMDEYIEHFADKLLLSSSAALRELKHVLWAETDHWDQLLDDRAAISGKLVITQAAQQAIHNARIA